MLAHECKSSIESGEEWMTGKDKGGMSAQSCTKNKQSILKEKRMAERQVGKKKGL